MTAPTPTRASSRHPYSLASLLTSWHLDESPVRDESWAEKMAKASGTPESRFMGVLRDKDQPRSIILDPNLVPHTWSAFTSFVERNALPAYEADAALLQIPGSSQTFLSTISTLREEWQTEPVHVYAVDCFKGGPLRSLPVRWVRALDVVLPPELRGGRASSGRPQRVYKGERDAQGEIIPCETCADGVFYKECIMHIMVDDRSPRSAYLPSGHVPSADEGGEGRRLVHSLAEKGPVMTAREFSHLTAWHAKDVYLLLSKVGLFQVFFPLQ